MTDTPQPYRIRSPETRAAARDAFLAGESAESVSVRFDLGLSAFRKRAKAEGWRRADQPDPSPLDPDFDEDEDGDDDFDAADMARIAWRRVGRAIARGHSAEAARWLRLHAHLTAPERARERAEARAETERRRAEHDAADARMQAITHVARKLALDPSLLHSAPVGPGLSEVDDVHDVHPEFPPPPANRAERRRLARMERAGASP